MTDAERDYNDMRRFQEAYIVADQKSQYLRNLCGKAADALESSHYRTGSIVRLIAELRKAALAD